MVRSSWDSMPRRLIRLLGSERAQAGPGWDRGREWDLNPTCSWVDAHRAFGQNKRDQLALGSGFADHPPSIRRFRSCECNGGISTSISVASGQPLVSATPMAPREALVLRAPQGQVRMHPCV